MLDLAEKMGLDDLISKSSKRDSPEHRAAFVRKMVIEGYRTGTLFDMVAVCLVEEGKEKWTIEDANEVSSFIGDLTDPADKQIVSDAITGIVVNFFAAARLSPVDSLFSSPQPGGEQTSTPEPTEEPSPVEHGPA
jgi:hypothetical protein